MKKFTLSVLLSCIALLCAGALLTAIVDPFFRLAPPGEREIYVNERYENPGLIRNMDYNTVVMGTSLVCNYRASWFDRAPADKALKIGYRDGYLSDFDTALNLAFRTHPRLKRVYFGLDLNILTRSEATRTVDLEPYLYNDNPLDDVAYFLNAEVYLRCANVVARRLSGTTTAVDDAYVWDGTCDFSRATALANYNRPPSGTPLPEGYYYAACDENLAYLDRWLTAHPETEFTVFFSPYSILYWDYAVLEGSAHAKLSALNRAVEALLRYDNLRVVFLMDEEEIITDLDHYTDYIHCEGSASRALAARVQGEDCLLTAENYKAALADFSNFIHSYDYEAIFAAPETAAANER